MVELKTKISEAQELANKDRLSEFQNKDRTSIQRLTSKLVDLSTYIRSREVRARVTKIIDRDWLPKGDPKGLEQLQALKARWAELGETLNMVVSAIEEDSERPADKAESSEQTPADLSVIFVVHGRNLSARDAIFRFLRAIKLSPLEWEEAKNMTNKATPSIPDVLDAAFGNAKAVVVVFTPDEIAKLREQHTLPSDTPEEIGPSTQVRPNVFFEAGIAFGRHADRTVLVQFGKCRPFTDISGLQIIHWDNGPKCRHSLAQALRRAGCPVSTEGGDWLTEGIIDLEQFTLQPDENQALRDIEFGLTEEEKELLKVAQKTTGQIWVLSAAGNEFVQIPKQELYDQNNTEMVAKYYHAHESLIKKGLVRHVEKALYRLTGQGHDVAKRLLELEAGPD